MNTAIILAGGLGTRLRSVVSEVPKSMAPVNGKPFLEYQMQYCIKQGIKNFILSVGYKHEIIIDYFQHQFLGAPIHYAIETVPLGTAGGLLNCTQNLCESISDDVVFVLNGDTFFPINYIELERKLVSKRADCCIALLRSIDSKRYGGVEISTDGFIKSIHANLNNNTSIINGGVYLFTRKLLTEYLKVWPKGTPASLENDLIPKIIADNKKVYGNKFKDYFLDIGVPEDYQKASITLPYYL